MRPWFAWSWIVVVPVVMFVDFFAVPIVIVVAMATAVKALEPLKYRNPGLIVDLGVGLWAWPIPCDVDGDGDYDLIVSCPDKPSNGVYFFENRGGDTQQDAMPVFQPAKKLSQTVHYITPSYVDGKLRVLSPGVEYLNFEKTGIQQKRSLPVKGDYFQSRGTAEKKVSIRHNQWSYADYNGDGRLDLIVGIEDWSGYGWDNAWDERGRWKNQALKGTVHVFYGRSDGSYAEPYQVLANGAPLETYGCPSPNFGHFDDDDDLDLICGSFLDGFTYYENRNTNSEPLYGEAKMICDPQGCAVKMELQMAVPVAFDWDRDGDLDLIVGDEDGRVAFVENTGKFHQGAPVFLQPRYFQQVADTLKYGALATPFAVDWDGDGDLDLVSGNTAGAIGVFENLSGAGVEKPRWSAPQPVLVGGKPFRLMAGENGSIQGPTEAKWGYTTLSVADWDGDGLIDVIFNSILGDVCWLKNCGTTEKPRFDEVRAIEVEWQGAAPHLAWGWRKPKGKALLTQWRTTPVVCDFTGDGLLDLVMLDQEGFLALFERNADLTLQAPRRAILDADGKPLRLNDKPAGGSGRRKLCLCDWDGDGDLDLLVNSINADIWEQVSHADGQWRFRRVGTIAAQNIEGHDVSPAAVDFDGNGIPDYLGGAEDGRFYYHKNPRAESVKK